MRRLRQSGTAPAPFLSGETDMFTKSNVRAFASCAALLMLGGSSVALAGDMASFATGGYARALRTPEMMDRIDRDGDHRVSKAEWDGYQERLFSMMDANQSGVLDHGEFMEAKSEDMASFATGGYASALRTREMLERIDADGDGQVSRAEFTAFQDKVFESMDTARTLILDKYQFFGQPAGN
jgi:hypothetical protein